MRLLITESQDHEGVKLKVFIIKKSGCLASSQIESDKTGESMSMQIENR